MLRQRIFYRVSRDEIRDSRKPECRITAAAVNNISLSLFLSLSLSLLSFFLSRITLGILPTEDKRTSAVVFAVKHGAFCGARLPGNVKHLKRQRELPSFLSLIRGRPTIVRRYLLPVSRGTANICAWRFTMALSERRDVYYSLSFSRFRNISRARARTRARTRDTARREDSSGTSTPN